MVTVKACHVLRMVLVIVDVGIDNLRKKISYCRITICRTYIVLINIGDDSISLALTTT